MKKFIYNDRDGISLLISLGLVVVIMLFALIVGSVVVSSVRQSANVNRANEAYYGAEGALELGLMANFKEGAGYTSSDFLVNYPNGNVEAKYKIEGQVPVGLKYGMGSAYDGMYGIPTPGTGNAGSDCDVLNPVISGGAFTYKDVNFAADVADHPCNWNKISVGESVSIPLYYFREDGNPVNLFTGTGEELILRVRTPCKDGEEMCLRIDRIDLLFISCGSLESLPCNDPLISWQIFGSSNGKNVTLTPFIEYGDDDEFTITSTMISEFVISRGTKFFNNFHVLEQTYFGNDIQSCKGEIIDFLHNSDNSLSNCGVLDLWSLNTIDKPTLRFSVINTLEDYNQNTYPHLEYQLLTSSNLGAPPTNVSQTIKAEGYSGSFKQVLEVKQPQESGLLEYVVQQ